METHWDIRREGRAWSAEEVRHRKDLRPEKLEIIDGKLLWYEEERVALAGILIENIGADAVVRLGDIEVWKSAVRARTPIRSDRYFDRVMTLLLFLHMMTLALIIGLFNGPLSVRRVLTVVGTGFAVASLGRFVTWFVGQD